MSNARILERLGALADQVELGEVSVAGFRDELLGHTEALERVPFAHLKEAQYVWAELTRALDRGQEPFVDVHALGDWLRRWVAQVPGGPA
jgi:hypothetical protein